ncbi:hypothetical protein N0V82_005802 [Gnomoniopsis sp. IMI 355080]|nr:hypothetical protein N0V82_005802 [Gnomoniopsis sp. IMI 355080]
MNEPESNPEQTLSAEAAQAAGPAGAAQPSPSSAPALQPDQQPIELEQSQQQPRQEFIGLDSPNQQQQQLLPPFQPLFTLVTDSTTGATHHAHVHYIFSDDEPDLLTDALGQYNTQHQQQQQQQTTTASSGSSSAKPAPPTTDRAILLDLVPKPSAGEPSSSSSTSVAPAYDVAWASSLSADWAVVSAKVTPMSADDNDTADMTATPARGADGALMLRIEGVELARPPRPRALRSKASLELSSGSSSGVGQSAAQQEDYGAIVDEFDKRMVVLRKVIEAGRERQLKMAPDGGAETGPSEMPAAEMPGHSVSHASVGYEQPESRPSGSRQASDSSGGGQQAGANRLSGGSGGRAEWEQQPVG